MGEPTSESYELIITNNIEYTFFLMCNVIAMSAGFIIYKN